MTTLCEFQHDQFCCAIPFAVWFVGDCPVSLIFALLDQGKSNYLWETFRHVQKLVMICHTKTYVVFPGPVNVVVHRHEHDAVLEVLRVDLEFVFHQFLDFLEKLRSSVPWENLPLEHERLTIEVVQFTIFWR